MAVRKATTTDDLKGDEPTSKPATEGYTTLIGPSGAETSVPDSILESLLDSGYKKK